MKEPAPSLDRIVTDALLKDRKVDRRWRNIRFFGWLFILVIYGIAIFTPRSADSPLHLKDQPYVALVRLNGTIMAGEAFSARRVIPELNKAFRDKKAKGVVLLMDSPGGSPVQSSIIHDKIIQLKAKFNKKVIVVAEDSLASGAYLVATAADKIFVNPDTVTGSIGVIMSGFGFTDAIHKLGITRRVFTAGTNKARLDSFEPLNTQDVNKIKTILDDVHQHFIQNVIEGRGKRLKGDRKELFSGDFWSGSEAVKLGIVDGTENIWTALHEEFNVEQYRDYSPQPSLIKQFLEGAETSLHLHLTYEGSPVREQAF